MFTKNDNLLLSAGVGPALRAIIVACHPTGSSYTCNPPVTTTDIDLYAFTRLNKSLVETVVVADGWESCLNEVQAQAYANTPGFNETWMAYRKGVYNLIIVYDERHYARCVAATELCKVLNLTNKDDRVRAHSLVHLDKHSELTVPADPYLRSAVNSLRRLPQWKSPTPAPMRLMSELEQNAREFTRIASGDNAQWEF